MDGYTLLALLIGAAFVYFTGRLLFTIVGGGHAVYKASREADAAMERSIAGLSTDELRRLIVEHAFLLDLSASPQVRTFLDRVARGEETALVSELTRSRFYDLLVGAEREAGGQGRPEAVDAVGQLWPYLEALARRRRGDAEASRNQES